MTEKDEQKEEDGKKEEEKEKKKICKIKQELDWVLERMESNHLHLTLYIVYYVDAKH